MATEEIPGLTATVPAYIATLPDLQERITALTQYINLGEAKLRLARQARTEAVKTCRTQKPPVTWRQIAHLTGTTENYWRTVLRRPVEP